jgi:hypothetical protein
MNRETALYVELQDPLLDGSMKQEPLPEMEKMYPYDEGERVVSHSISMLHGISPEGSTAYVLTVLLERIPE